MTKLFKSHRFDSNMEYMESLQQDSGSRVNIKMVFPGMVIPLAAVTPFHRYNETEKNVLILRRPQVFRVSNKSSTMLHISIVHFNSDKTVNWTVV